MRMSGTAGILLFAGAHAPGAPCCTTTSWCAKGQSLRQRLHRRDRIFTQGQDDSRLIMSVESLYVTGGLGLRERAKCERFSGNPEIRSHRINELQEYSVLGTPFMELACRMQIAWAVTGCRSHMVMGD